jgi:hypothetical protein
MKLPDARVTSSSRETKNFRGLDDDFGLKRQNHHLGPKYVHLFRAKKSMVYGETFKRKFKFYAKTLTKLHDLTARVDRYAQQVLARSVRTPGRGPCDLHIEFRWPSS